MSDKRKAVDTADGSEKKMRTEEKGHDMALGGAHTWKRPKLPHVNPRTDAIDMFLLEADYYTEFEEGQRAPVLRLFGVNMNGNSILAYIHGFKPYFYVPAWEGFTQKDLQLFGDALNASLADNSKEKGLKNYVVEMAVEKKRSLWGYRANQTNFMKVTVALPSLVATSRRLLENGISIGNVRRSFQTYESTMVFALRFMIDKSLAGGSWLTIAAGKYRVRSPQQMTSHCQLEVDLDNCNDLVGHPAEGEWLKIPPLRVLSFDIECAGRRGHFPTADIDPVIQIANVVQCQGSQTPFIKNVFTLKSCSPIVGSQVLSFEEEGELLRAWRNFWEAVDADVITGYNIINFDLPYLLDRAKALKVKDFPYLGRLKDQETIMKDTKFMSKAHGTRENKDINILGRVQFDVLQIARRDFKLRSYSLNSVSAHFLGQQKEDVHYSIITDLQNGDSETRKRLAVYCIKDAWLPLRLIDKLMLLINYIEMARVTGVPLTFLLTRGQQIKVVSQLYRKAKSKGFVVPVREKQMSDDKFEGATVIEPKRGYYTEPIATLDFASLYPSIMMAHNLCYTTLTNSTNAAKLPEGSVSKTPNGDYFVKDSVQKGLLPEILNELLTARKKAKRDMAAATDPFTKAVLNGRQLALKISANSVYGFTGAQVGQLPCLAISSSVTSYGREMIEQTKSCVESKYTIANGFKFDAEVVYGDTDSVMVKFGGEDIAEAMRLGREAALEVTKEFINPIKLEFEKVYWPYLLMNKKRYAGLYWTNPDKWDHMDTKGIETVRRDNCALVKNLVKEVLNQILIHKSVEGATKAAKQTISNLLQNRVDLSELVITKQLGKSAQSEDYTMKQAHVELAERMRKRDPSTAPMVGDRVAYVMTQAAKNAKAYEKAEDPIFVLENGIPIDTQYYVDNQLRKPLERLFEPIMGDVKSLFAGDHTRSIKKATPTAKSGGIMMFAKKVKTCMGCKVPLKGGEKTVCQHCEVNQADLYIKQVDKIREYEVLYSRAWTQCQRCQGSLHQDVICSSRDCPIFYRRKKVQKDLSEAQEGLSRFDF